jgi:hypothetical protein
VVKAFADVGRDGVIRIVRLPPEQLAGSVEMRMEEGRRFPLSGCPDWALGLTLDVPGVLVFRSRLSEADVAALLNLGQRLGKPCLLLAPGIEAKGLDLARVNYEQRRGQLIPCVPPDGSRWQDLFLDVAVVTGARILETGPAAAPGDVGTALTISLEANTVVVYGGQEKPAEFKQYVRDLAELSRQENPIGEQQWLAERLARLLQTVAEVRVSGDSPEESERLEDLACSALQATRSFIAHGAVPGGGTGYLLCSEAASSSGAKALAAGLEAPARCLLEQASLPLDSSLAKLRKSRENCLDLSQRSLVKWRTEGPLDPAAFIEKIILRAAEVAARLVSSLADRT